jgi:cell division protein FtsB
MSNGHKTSGVPRPRASAPRVRPAGPGLRPVADDRARLDRSRADRADQTQLGSRPIDDDHQLVTRRPHRLFLAIAGFAIVVAIVAALFVLPVQAWLRQEDEIVEKQQELAVLTEANRKLGTEVDHLGTPEGAKEAARDELGVIGPGEERISVLPTQTGPLPLPAGWPYDTFTQIVAVRQAAPAAPAAP